MSKGVMLLMRQEPGLFGERRPLWDVRVNRAPYPLFPPLSAYWQEICDSFWDLKMSQGRGHPIREIQGSKGLEVIFHLERRRRRAGLCADTASECTCTRGMSFQTG